MEDREQINSEVSKKIGFGDATVHELKTLLTAIIVSAELLVEELQATKESMPLRLTQNIIRSAHSLDEKLSHFSEMAGLLSGEFSFQPELLDKYIQDTGNNLEKEKAKLERKLKPIQGSINQAKESMSKADTMYELGRLTTEDYKARIAGLKARMKELEKQTTDADPMLLKQLADTERQLKYWAGYAHLKNFMTKKGKTLRTGPALDVFSTLQALAPISNFDIYDHPQETITQQLRRMGLYAYIYPKAIEIKGAIRQSNVIAAYRSARCRRFQ